MQMSCLSLGLLTVIVSLGFSSTARAGLSDAQSLTRVSSFSFSVVCADGSVETRGEAEILDNRLCERGSSGGHLNGNAIFGRSDSCAAEFLVGRVDTATSCSMFSTTTPAWSVLRDGECVDISDTDARTACNMLQVGGGGSVRRNAMFGTSDSCEVEDFLATIDGATDCSIFSASTRVWSVQMDGECRNISDSNAKVVCLDMVSEITGKSVIYGTSDSCAVEDALVLVDQFTNCESLSNSERAWSIRQDGVCHNIDDTTPRNACRILQLGL